MKNETRLGWGDRVGFLVVGLTIISFTFLLYQEGKRAEEWYRQDKIISEQKWTTLFERFHDLDKAMERFIPKKQGCPEIK